MELAVPQQNVPFDKRLKRINRRHDRMAKGAVRVVQPDGLIVTRPRMYRPRFPLKSIVALLLMGFLFKGFMLANLGADAYDARLANLAQGTMMERAGAWAMQLDPVTVAIAGQISRIAG